MFEDSFYQTQKGEIFQKSGCMQHEHAVASMLHSLLLNLGYDADERYWRRVWRRKDKTVIVSLGDDFNVCGANLDQDPAQWFDNHTTVITDNHINFETNYRVIQLPESYFGVYSYQPNNLNFDPQRRLGFCVNRLDNQRQLILFELVRQCGGLDQLLENSFINFNCWDSDGANDELTDVRNNFKKYWNKVNDLVPEYTNLFDTLVNRVPILNFDTSIETAHVSSLVNLVVETYAGNYTNVLTEKTFRALSTPAPWTLFAAQNTVKYLRNLGFDVMDELICHDYDSCVQSWPGTDKISLFIRHSIELANKLQNSNTDTIKATCEKSARHNRSLLQQMKQQWPADFAKCLPTIVELIQ